MYSMISSCSRMSNQDLPENGFPMMFFSRCTSCIMMFTISPNVDFVGHFAGMLAGFLLAIILADMQEEHQPPWYNKAKLTAPGTSVAMVVLTVQNGKTGIWI